MFMFSAVLYYLRGFAQYMGRRLLGDDEEPMYILDEDVPSRGGRAMWDSDVGGFNGGLWLSERDLGWKFELMG